MIKPVLYTSHAETVIRERRLEKHWIIEAVRFPDWVTTDPLGDGVERRFHRVLERDGRHIRVVCVETSQEIRIISAFLDRNARRP